MAPHFMVLAQYPKICTFKKKILFILINTVRVNGMNYLNLNVKIKHITPETIIDQKQGL